MIIANSSKKSLDIEVELIEYLESDQSTIDLTNIIKNKNNKANRFYYDIFEKRFNEELIIGRSFLNLETKNNKSNKTIDQLIEMTKKDIIKKLESYQTKNIKPNKKWSMLEAQRANCLTYDLEDDAFFKLVSSYVYSSDLTDTVLMILDDEEELDRVKDLIGDDIYSNNKENSREFILYKMLVDKEVLFEELISSKFNFFKLYNKIGHKLIHYFLSLKKTQIKFIAHFNQEDLLIRLLNDYLEYLDSHKDPTNVGWALIPDFKNISDYTDILFKETQKLLFDTINDFYFKNEYTIFLDMKSPNVIHKNLLKLIKNKNISVKLISSDKDDAFEYIYGKISPINKDYKIYVGDNILKDLLNLKAYIDSSDLRVTVNKKILNKLNTFELGYSENIYLKKSAAIKN